MTIEALRELHAQYRAAVEATRNPESDEALEAASADMLARRHALDAALIENEQDRQDQERMAAAEARDHARRRIDDAGGKVARIGLPVDEIRKFARGERGPITCGDPQGAVGNVLRYGADFTTTDTTTYSSYGVPQSWASEVIDFAIADSGLLAAGPNIITTQGGNQINMPALVTDATAVAGAEGTAATQTNVVFGTRALNAYRFDGYFSVANELLADAGFDVEGQLRKYAGRAIAAKINPYFTDPDIGTGSSTIAAVQVGCTSAFTAAGYAVGDVGLDQLKQLKYNVLPVYRTRGKFVANSALTLATAQAKDGNGQYLWQPSNAADEPDMLFGSPWFEDAYMDSFATGNEPVIYGDIDAGYTVRYGHGGMQFIVSKEFAVTSFETTFVWGVWVDAVATDAIAIKSITLA